MKWYSKNKKALSAFISATILSLLFYNDLAFFLLKIGALIDYESIAFKIAFSIFLIYIIVHYCIAIFKTYLLNKNTTLLIAITTTIYLILLFTENDLYFESFIDSNRFLRYANIIFLVLFGQVMYLIKNTNWKSLYARNVNNFNEDIKEFRDSSFIEDALFEGEIDNELMLNRLLGVLSNFMPNTSFCVGLNALWGHGKSSFLLRFELKYRELHKDNIIFWNNIWKNQDSNAIIENFFNVLKEHLAPFSADLDNTIDNYVEAILTLPSSKIQTIVNAGSKLLSQDKTLESYYNEINRTIKKMDKQIVIILDDLDRLEKCEILSSLKLIRTLSDFNNVIFITGYDRNYITSKLGPEYDGYIDKIFNVEINFLPSAPNLLAQFLIEEVEKIENPNKGLLKSNTDITLSDSFKNLFSNVKELGYSDFFKTYRDVKRFINEFRFNLTFLDDIKDVQLDQYIILKLCTFKYRFTQNLIFNDLDSLLTLGVIDTINEKVQHASFENQNVYIYDDEAKKKVKILLKGFAIEFEDINVIDTILKYLFSEKDLKFYANKNNSISKIYFTELYIKNNISTGKIKISDIQNAFEVHELHKIANEITELPTQLKGQIKNELMNFILYKITINTTEELADVLKTINLSMISYSIEEDNKILKLIDETSDRLYGMDANFVNPIESLFINEEIGYLDNLLSEVNINEKRLKNGTYSSNNIAFYSTTTFDDTTIKNLCLKKLEKLVVDSVEVEKVLNAYHLYTQAIVENKKILRSSEANQEIKKDIEKRFKEYIEYNLLDFVHSGPKEGFENIRSYSPPHFYLQIFSLKKDNDDLLKDPKNAVLLEKLLKEGSRNYKVFLQSKLKNLEAGDELFLRVDKMIELLDKYEHIGYEPLSFEEYDKIMNPK